MNTAILSKQYYLVSGPFLTDKAENLKDASLELVTNKIFGLETTNNKQTLVATDDKGVLRSISSDSTLKPQPKQHLSPTPLKISVIPNGAARASYFANVQTWQKNLLEKINGEKEKFIECKPIIFSKKHLIPPSESSSAEYKDFYNSLGDATINGQLIRKIRGAFLIFSSEYFVNGTINAMLFDDKGKKIRDLSCTDEKPLSYISTLNEESISSNYRIFYIDDIYYELQEGRYRIEINKNYLERKSIKWCDSTNLSVLSFNFELKFSIYVLTGEFDFHQLDPLSLEESLLTQYSHRFSHIHKSLMKEPTKDVDANYNDYKTGLKTWIERTEWFNEKQKLIIGFINGDTDGRINFLGKQLFNIVKEANQDNQSVKKDADQIADFWDAAYSIIEAKKSWDEYLSKLKVSESANKIKQTINGNWITKNCQSMQWKKFLLSHVDDEEKSSLVIELFDKGLTKEKAAILIKDGMPKQAVSFDKALLKTAGKALAALDTAMSIYQIANLISQRFNLENQFELHNSRFVTGSSNYISKFGTRANVQAITMLEVLRRTADTTKMDLDDNAKELLQQSIDFVLGVAAFIPVIDNLAAFIVAAKLTVEAVSNYAVALGKVIDRKFLDEYFSELSSYFGQLAEIEQETSVNMNAIHDLLKSGKKPNDPAVQFRLRAGILAGLLRLIDRCGSRYNNEAEFDRKVKQYDIQGYIETFILNPSSSSNITIQSDIPLDEIWLFCHGNKVNMGLMAVHRGFRILKNNKWAIPAVIVTQGNAGMIAGAVKTIELMTAYKVPLSFQRMFPIHLQNSTSTLQLAKIFTTNRSGIKESNLKYSNVYVSVNKKWIDIANCTEMITPIHQIRVIVVMEAKNPKENLAGLPVSIQLVRTDTIPDIYGPVYKGQIQKLTKTKAEGFDKGLLPEEVALFKGKDCFGFVLHPFYFFEDGLLKGTKPCGHIGISKLPETTNKFVLKIGEKQFDIVSGSTKKSEYNVKLPLVSPFTNMIIRKDFINNKTSDIVYTPVFLGISDVGVLGYFIKNHGNWYYKSAELGHLYHTKDFEFAWNKPFEIIFVLRTMAFHMAILKNSNIKFPVQITALEDNMINLKGPQYPGEANGFNEKVFYRGFSTVKEIEFVLKGGNILKADEHIGNENDKVEFKNAYRLCAIRMQFAYTVENKDGDMASYDSFKPFGKKYNSADTEYEYLFKIDAPNGIGMPSLSVNTTFHMPGIPSNIPDMSFLASKKFVTWEPNHSSLEIQKSDFE